MTPLPFSVRNPSRLLFVASFLSLYLELVLIRWVGTEVNIFAYLQNTLLVVSFLGLGAGYLTSEQQWHLPRSFAAFLVLTTALSLDPCRKALGAFSILLSKSGDFVVWNQALSASPTHTIASVALGLVGAFIILILVFDTFLPLGRLLGALMSSHPQIIRAYSLNVAASLLGLWCFTLSSRYFMPPWGWTLIVALLAAAILFDLHRLTPLAGTALGLTVAISAVPSLYSTDLVTLWSPYQKIALREAPTTEKAFRYNVLVNNYPFQGVANTLDEMDWDDPRILYDLPLLLVPEAKTVLVVGSGTGNDIAGALRHHVESITAVEIDPAVIQLGKGFHPQHPYDSPKVKLVNDDARAFVGKSKEKFDLIVVAMLDSHTTNSMTNARLDHYVYTVEGLRQAKERLAPGGVMVLSFFAQRPYIADRISQNLAELFGTNVFPFRFPLQSHDGAGGTIFVAGNVARVQEAIAASTRLRSMLEGWKTRFPLTLTGHAVKSTDDWPYLYHRGPEIPLLFYFAAGLIGLLLIYAAARHGVHLGISEWGKASWHFFFLGAGFLLLEVQNISKAAVALGNTWDVNVVVISGILAMVLLGNLVATRCRNLPALLLYLGLCACCTFLYLFDLASLVEYSLGGRAVLVGLLTSLPMLFSSTIFARSLEAAKRKDLVLGANLVGAVCGGILQSLSFVFGIRALLVFVLAFYLAAAASEDRNQSAR